MAVHSKTMTAGSSICLRKMREMVEKVVSYTKKRKENN
jgi:hypothetical protein